MTVVHHAGLCPADLESSLRFYRDGIGLTVLADFTMQTNLHRLLGQRTEQVRAVFLGSLDSPQGGTLELLDLGDSGGQDELESAGLPHRGVFLLSFCVDIGEVLNRLNRLGMGGDPRVMSSSAGDVIAATVVDPDGVTVELMPGPISQLPQNVS